ncbi:hypothetical protein D3C75_1323840 [compost metagenome]
MDDTAETFGRLTKQGGRIQTEQLNSHFTSLTFRISHEPFIIQLGDAQEILSGEIAIQQ